MRIDAYAVSASATSQYVSQSSTSGLYRQVSGDGTGGLLAANRYQSSVSLTTVNQFFAGTGNKTESGKELRPKEGEEKPGEDELDISEEARRKREKMRLANLRAGTADGLLGGTAFPSNQIEFKARVLEMLLAFLEGREQNNYNLQPLKNRIAVLKGAMDEGGSPIFSGASGSDGAVRSSGARNADNTNQAQFSYMERTQEYRSESISYSAQGVVRTADGQEISFDVKLNMSSEFAKMTFSQGVGTASDLNLQLCDPLVINYAGTASSLTQTKFEFDLDFDGSMDQISFAGQGSGFLVLDKNEDGVINDGRELFGPQSGSGFGELSSYDKDGNMWIDENDEIYSKLRIWSKDENGNDQLFTLKELDIGAIFLGSTKTGMTMYDQTYDVNGQVQATGIFLKDSGGAGIIQHIDLAV